MPRASFLSSPSPALARPFILLPRTPVSALSRLRRRWPLLAGRQRRAARAPYLGAAGLRRPGGPVTTGGTLGPAWGRGREWSGVAPGQGAQGSRPRSGCGGCPGGDITGGRARRGATARGEQGAAWRCPAQPGGGRKRGAWLPRLRPPRGSTYVLRAAGSGYFGQVSGGSGEVAGAGSHPRPLPCRWEPPCSDRRGGLGRAQVCRTRRSPQRGGVRARGRDHAHSCPSSDLIQPLGVDAGEAGAARVVRVLTVSPSRMAA